MCLFYCGLALPEAELMTGYYSVIFNHSSVHFAQNHLFNCALGQNIPLMQQHFNQQIFPRLIAELGVSSVRILMASVTAF
jgi:hypothetical protein